MGFRDPVYDPPQNDLEYRWLVEENLAGIYLVKGDRFLYVNRTMAELFGYSPEELVHDHHVEDVVAPADRRMVMENLRRRLSGEIDTLHYTFRGLHQNGTLLDVEVRGRRTQSLGGPAVLGTLLDVSDRIQERQRLRFLARAAELLDSSLDYETTLESLTRLMIPSFADLCFIDIVVGEETRRLASVPWGPASGDLIPLEEPEDDGSDVPSPALVIRSGRGELLEQVPAEVRRRVLDRLPDLTGTDPDDIRSMIMVPLIARGTALGVMTLVSSTRSYSEKDFEFAREVARGAALAVDNARLYQEARLAIRQRDEVLAIVSHDLRNPLNVILMGTALGMEQERRAGGPLEMIHHAAKQMERLICDLLDLSAIRAHGFSVDLARRPIGPTIAKALAMLESSASGRGVHLEYSIHASATEVMIDETRITQALFNLVANAVKFTPPGGTVCVDVRNGGDFVEIAVRDTGPGIPKDQLDQIFERFWRGEARDDGGAGLGLAIVKGIAEAHGGSVHAESEPGEGATFRLELPVAP